jgi:large subunit ribosomal protein L6
VSKIGRKPIEVQGVSVTVQGQQVQYKGPRLAGVHVVPEFLSVQIKDSKLLLNCKESSNKNTRDINRVWGLEHALLQNKIKGARSDFEKKLKITGLGFSAAIADANTLEKLKNQNEIVFEVGEKGEQNKGLLFKLGYSHLFYSWLPNGVSVEIDKSGQNLTLRSNDPVIVGTYASQIRTLREPEPYKGTGIKGEFEVIRRKAGKKTG